MGQKSGETMWSSSWIKKSDMDITEDIIEDIIMEDMIKTDMIKTGDMDMMENMTNAHKGNQSDNDKL
jgi:hypothetical protein